MVGEEGLDNTCPVRRLTPRLGNKALVAAELHVCYQTGRVSFDGFLYSKDSLTSPPPYLCRYFIVSSCRR